mgnify:FL=1
MCPYSLDVPGGVQGHVLDLAEALVARGHHVGVIAPGRESHRPHVTIVGAGFAVRYNGATSRVRLAPRRLRAWLREGDYDVIHVHEPTAPSIGLHALKLARVPTVATFHMALPKSRALRMAGRAFQARLGNIDARIAVSAEARRTTEAHLGHGAAVIPNGIHTSTFRQAPPISLGSEAEQTVLFVGRFEDARKGFEALVRALQGRPNTQILVAGPGRPRANSGMNLRFLGHVDELMLASLLATADVVAAPNLGGESFGMVVLEAMAAGACIVASDIPAFAALTEAGRAARLVPPGDSVALGEAIDSLLNSPSERLALGRAAAEMAAAYDWSTVVPQIESVYLSARSRTAFASTPLDS